MTADIHSFRSCVERGSGLVRHLLTVKCAVPVHQCENDVTTGGVLFSSGRPLEAVFGIHGTIHDLGEDWGHSR